MSVDLDAAAVAAAVETPSWVIYYLLYELICIVPSLPKLWQRSFEK